MFFSDIDYDVDSPTDTPYYDFDVNDWLFDLLDESSVCDPNPCFNGGSCQSKSRTEFTCSCPEPYTGKRCQKVKDICDRVRCGNGECMVNLKKPPYYECKCRPPYRGPDCKTLPASACEPNPCQNGASCIKGKRRFHCACSNGYTGKFCEINELDCFMGNGESYRGAASVTEKGEECLDWHSYFIVRNGEDPFTTYSDFSGLEQNNHCRNPDGDEKPWCFIKKRGALNWGFCKIKKCTEVTTTTPLPATPTTGSSQFSQCGKLRPFRNSRIFGGTKSAPGSHPWQVSVQVRPKRSSSAFGHVCGGILLNSCWVLTAAHCIDNTNEFQVVLGGVNIEKREEMDQTIPVIETIVHENYRETQAALYNDVALLKLKVTNSPYCARETPFVKSVCLPERPFPSGKECVISGWGATETQRYSSQLLNARVFLISKERCQTPQVYGNLLDNSMLCAGTLQGGIDSCQVCIYLKKNLRGDSGGPLVCEENGTHYITGVVSWGVGCGEKKKPGVYANVHTFLNWIKSNIN
ncbi:unnamed protein product [Menidia menidia]|uniref:trypsin n=1 Tax=Menidia menidia TaxID=238744 RepID=A0A8S4B2U3_9TELE|nr:unnamed protein product [Menidia menidia]